MKPIISYLSGSLLGNVLLGSQPAQIHLLAYNTVEHEGSVVIDLTLVDQYSDFDSAPTVGSSEVTGQADCIVELYFETDCAADSGRNNLPHRRHV